MRALQKLCQRGNSTGVSIPRGILVYLGWMPGESVIVELLEDGSIRVRRPREADFAPIGIPRILPTSAPVVTR